jgi:hypothetical protein
MTNRYTHHNNYGRFQGHRGVNISSLLFKKLICVNDLQLPDEDRMKCHILNCIVALRRMQTGKNTNRVSSADKQYESAKNRIFAAALFYDYG